MASSFEFRFVSVVSSHADNQGENEAVDDDLKKLNDLGKEGWQITGIGPDPQHPAARLMASLQRETMKRQVAHRTFWANLKRLPE